MALCTRDDVKLFGTITDSTDAADTLIKDLIDRVSTRIERYCDRVFEEATYTEYYDGTGTDYLYTNQYPIVTISGIYDDTLWAWGEDTLISGTEYRISNNKRKVLYNTYFTDASENIKIVYTAGYTTIPYDIQQVCITEVLRIYKRKLEPDVSSKSMQDGGQNVYITDAFLPSSVSVLNSYKRLYVI